MIYEYEMKIPVLIDYTIENDKTQHKSFGNFVVIQGVKFPNEKDLNSMLMENSDAIIKEIREEPRECNCVVRGFTVFHKKGCEFYE